MSGPAYERESILDAARRIVRQYQRAVKRATIRSRRFIRDITHRRDLAENARRREAAYHEVREAFEEAADKAGKAFEREARAHVDAVARDAAEAIAKAEAEDGAKGGAKDGAKETGTKQGTKPRPAAKPHPLTPDEFVTALDGKTVRKLVATATNRMSEGAIRQLRQAFVDVYRRAKVEGWTANELHKALQERWDELAGDEEAYRFVDRAGRRWSNARYLQMAVRTTMARLTREAFLKECVENGIDVVRVSEDAAEVCEVCQKWRGQYLSITGATPGFPTLADAQGEGLFHPNCIHRLEYVTKRELRRIMAERAAQEKP